MSKQTGGDYGSTHMVLLGIGLLVVGARRLQHLCYLANNSLFARFCTLSRVPSDRTVVNWLKLSTQTSLGALMRLNRELLYQPGQHHGPRPAAVGANAKPIHGRSYDGPRLTGWLAQNTPGTLPPTNTTSGSGDNENGA